MLFGALAAWEVLNPRRRLSQRKPRRWLNNLALALLDVILLRLIFPAAAVGVAWFAERHGLGLLHMLPLPAPLAVALSLLALDLVLYLQHLVFHAVPALWRVHRVHHSDLDYDVTTALRFHPIEIGLSMLVKAAAILALGAPPLAAALFELLLNCAAMFNHSNGLLPQPVERRLRWFIVTPDMHRVHHSARGGEMNANFGFNLPLWDRLFGTYVGAPRSGHEAMTLGLPDERDPESCIRLGSMLAFPFTHPPLPAPSRPPA